MTRNLVALAALALCACSQEVANHQPSAEEARAADMVEKAKASVLPHLKDPTSPLWGAFWTDEGAFVCGYVNSKNSLGAYTGPRLFVAIGGDTVAFDGDETTPKAFVDLLRNCRTGKINLLAGGSPSAQSL